MCRKHGFICLLLLLLLGTNVQAATVVWVSDDKSGTQADQLWFELLEDGQYEMIEDFRARQGRGTLSAAQIAQLEAADLIIISRDTHSGEYNNEQWNELTTPIIQLNAYLVRSNRWGWLATTRAVKGLQPLMEIALGEENHPVFRSLGFNDENYQIDILTDVQSFVDVFDVGNGKLLSYRADDTYWPWIVTWEANTEFYPGGGRSAAGPRMYFAGSADSEAQIGPPGAMNFTREGQIILLNAVDFLTGQKHPYPTLPVPVADAILDSTAVELMWRAGISATSHKIYLSTSASEVEACAESALLTTTEGFSVPAGDLVPGESYHWRVVEVNDADPASPWKGAVWNFMMRPLHAFDPHPIDTEPWVALDSILSWQYGVGAVAHDLYLSKDQQAVIDRSAAAYKERLTSDPNGLITQYNPGLLEAGQTYYWSVDVVKADDDKVAGPVWQFTTVAAEVDGLVVQYFDNRGLIGTPVVTQEDDQINFDFNTPDWPPAPLSTDAAFSARWAGEFEVPFTDTYIIVGTAFDGVRIYLNGQLMVDHWTQHGDDAIGSASPPVALAAGDRHSILMEYFFHPGSPGIASEIQARLEYSSTRFANRPIPRGAFQKPVKAYAPQPAPSATEVDPYKTLSWSAPEDANTYHVYLGMDEDQVAQANVQTTAIYQGPQKETSFTPDSLEWNATYYWRVDVVAADGSIQPGWVWSFTTANGVIVDDFESYDSTEGKRVWETWSDGYGGNPELGGSRSGHLDGLLVETGRVHSGYASFPLYYEQDGSFEDYELKVTNPVFSEVRRRFEPAQNWMTRDSRSFANLSLWFRGRTINNLSPLSLVVTDAAENEVTVPYETDPNAMALTAWTQWTVPLGQLSSAGVDLTQVQSLGIRVGDKEATLMDGSGILFIDDIQLQAVIED